MKKVSAAKTNALLSLYNAKLKNSTCLSGKLFASLAFATLAVSTSNSAKANPQGGQVVAGSATITQAVANKTDIHQNTDKAIINWKSFNIDKGETTQFYQPSSNAIAYNRVTGVDPSKILGNLTANGKVFLVNPSGIFFGKDARIDVNGLIASTADMKNSDFLKGSYKFNIPGKPNASIVNRGTITAKDAGLVALVAPGVKNDGVIKADLGVVVLGAGQTATFDFYGDSLINFAINSPTKAKPLDENGKPLSAALTNGGSVSAGSVYLTASAVKSVVDSAINMTGIVEASSSHKEGGTVVFDGGDGSVNISGKVNAKGTHGGKIDVVGQEITLANGADLDASGTNGGGKIRVGGDYQGSGSLPQADKVEVAKDAILRADAIDEGNGGTIILWSKDLTDFQGFVSATGGHKFGDGGFAEISGHILKFAETGNVDLSATNGNSGNLLLDPLNVVIDSVGTNDVKFGAGSVITAAQDPASTYSISTSKIVTLLNNNNVKIAAGSTIDVNSAIDASGNSKTANNNRENLTLTAVDAVNINAGSGIKLKNGGDLNLNSDGTVKIAAAINLGTGNLTVNGDNNAKADFVNVGSTTINAKDVKLNTVSGVLLNPGSNVTASGDFVAKGGSVNAFGALSAKTIKLTATGSSATLDGNVLLGSDTISATGGDFTADAGDGISGFNSNVSATGDIVLTSVGTTSFDFGSKLNATGNTSIGAADIELGSASGSADVTGKQVSLTGPVVNINNSASTITALDTGIHAGSVFIDSDDVKIEGQIDTNSFGLSGNSGTGQATIANGGQVKVTDTLLNGFANNGDLNIFTGTIDVEGSLVLDTATNATLHPGSVILTAGNSFTEGSTGSITNTSGVTNVVGAPSNPIDILAGTTAHIDGVVNASGTGNKDSIKIKADQVFVDSNSAISAENNLRLVGTTSVDLNAPLTYGTLISDTSPLVNVVSNNGSIADAMIIANTGGEVKLGSDTFDQGTITIDKSLTLSGVDNVNSIITANGNSAGVVVNANDVTVKDIAIADAADIGLDAFGQNEQITGVSFYNNGLYQLKAETGSTFGAVGVPFDAAVADDLVANNQFDGAVILLDNGGALRDQGIFSHIKDAVVAAFDGVGDQVKVYAGSYNEGAFDIDKSLLTIFGAQAGISGNDISRPAKNESQVSSSTLTIKANDVTIDGIFFDSSIIQTGGAAVNNLTLKNNLFGSLAGQTAVALNDNVNNLVVDNNAFFGGDGGLYSASSDGAQVTNNSFNNKSIYGADIDSATNLLVDNNSFESDASGLYVVNSGGAQITNNTLVGNDSGIYVGNSPGVVVDGNTIDSINLFGYGILLASGSNDAQITNNSITGGSGLDIGVEVAGSDRALIAGNSFTDVYYPVYNSFANNTEITNNSFIQNILFLGNGIGVYVDSSDLVNIHDNATPINGYEFGAYIDGSTSTRITNTAFDGNTYGLWITDKGAQGSVDTIINNSTFSNGLVGIYSDGPNSVFKFAGPSSSFSSSLSYYIQLNNSGLNGQTVDATNQLFDGVKGPDMDAAQYQLAEDMIVDFFDNPLLGTIVLKTATIPGGGGGGPAGPSGPVVPSNPIVTPTPPVIVPGGNGNSGGGTGTPGGGTGTGLNFTTNVNNNLNLGDLNLTFSLAGVTGDNVPSSSGQGFSFGTTQNLSLLGSGGNGNGNGGGTNFAGLSPEQLGGIAPAAGGDNNGAPDGNCGNNALDSGSVQGFDAGACQ